MCLLPTLLRANRMCVWVIIMRSEFGCDNFPYPYHLKPTHHDYYTTKHTSPEVNQFDTSGQESLNALLEDSSNFLQLLKELESDLEKK